MIASAQRQAFDEASRELATELGQTPVRVNEYECLIPSKSTPGKVYRMAWAPVSGWVHADSSCPSFRECWHRKEAENMTSLVVRNGSEIAARPVLLVEYDAQALSAGADPAVVAKWAYNLPGGGGQGVGVRGAEEGLRLLASHGEVIRVDSVVMAHQDDREAFFMATASRYVVNPDGTEVKLDSQQRGKRVSKWEQHSETYMRDHRGASLEYFNPNWFELGIVKASRNAALALMPSNVKSALLKAGLDAQGGGGGQRQQSTRRPLQQRREAPSIEDTAPFAPQDEDEAAVTAPLGADPDAPADSRLIEQIGKVLIDLKSSWPASDYGALLRDLSSRFAWSNPNDYQKLTAVDAEACMQELRQRRGEPA